MENTGSLLFTFCWILYVADRFFPSLKKTREYILLDHYLEEHIRNDEIDIIDADIPKEMVENMTSLRNQIKILCAIFPTSKGLEALSLISE